MDMLMGVLILGIMTAGFLVYEAFHDLVIATEKADERLDSQTEARMEDYSL